MLLRVFLHLQPINNSTFWRDVGVLYLEQLVACGFDVCAVGLGMAGDLREDGCPVLKFPKLFFSRGLDPSVTLVIGWGEDFGKRICTAKRNVVLTACRPRPPKVHEMEELAKFDHVLVPTAAEGEELLRHGIAGYKKFPLAVPPKKEDLTRFFNSVFAECGETK